MKNLLRVGILLIAAPFACQSVAVGKAPEAERPRDLGQTYFPLGSLDQNLANHLAKTLADNGEQSFLNHSNGTSFRLTCYALTAYAKLRILRLDIAGDGHGTLTQKVTLHDGTHCERQQLSFL